MKSFVIIVVQLFLFGVSVLAQSPSGINYQSVVRGANGQVLENQSVTIKISILEGTVNGSSVYQETHSLTTNDFGLINAIIGQGSNQTGSIASIDWGSNSHFIKTELDANGGTSFTEMGTSQIMTVPYSFYSEEAGKLKGGNGKMLIYTGGL